MLFVHGMFLSARFWEPVLPAFAEHTRIVYDVEPFGETRPSGASLDAPSQARDTRDLLTHFEYSTAVVVAHSAGGSIARQFAHDYPHMVHKLVLLGPLFLPFPPEFPLDWIVVPTEELVRGWQSMASKRGQEDPALMKFVRDEVERNADRKEDAFRYFEGIRSCRATDVGGVETWVLMGTEEQTPGVDCQGAAEALNARLVKVEGAGHHLVIENTSGTVGALRAALVG